MSHLLARYPTVCKIGGIGIIGLGGLVSMMAVYIPELFTTQPACHAVHPQSVPTGCISAGSSVLRDLAPVFLIVVPFIVSAGMYLILGGMWLDTWWVVSADE
jgi:hypothetical protein